MSTDPVPVTVYSRENCHLCAAAVETMEDAAADVSAPVELAEVDVDDDPDLRAAYGDRVPVVEIAGEEAFEYRVDPGEARRLLRAAAD
ncbi:MAG: glutaredoxin family protein [Haloarculaceae archaeon]